MHVKWILYVQLHIWCTECRLNKCASVKCLQNLGMIQKPFLGLASCVLWQVTLPRYSHKESAAFCAGGPKTDTQTTEVSVRHLAFSQIASAYCCEDRCPLENNEKQLIYCSKNSGQETANCCISTESPSPKKICLNDLITFLIWVDIVILITEVEDEHA